MFGKIGALREALSAALNMAPKGFLFCMDPEMVKEITPFAELFSAALVLALHYTSYSFCLSMFILKYFIMCRIWNIFAFTYAMKCLTLL
jgi:hypothetical protein